MNHPNQAHPQLLGLVELDQAGTVLYARLQKGEARRNLGGLNFFSDVAPFKNVAEFRRRVEDFANGPTMSDSFDFICDFDDGPVPVRVLLARIRERMNGAQTTSILVLIRQALSEA